MAITKVINVDVNTGDANTELQKLEGSFKDVDQAAEQTNKSVDDVAGNGGAIAILDQLTGGLATRFRDAFEASKLFNLSLKGTKTALIATGIGAFVVALGLVVAYWDDIVDFITQANAKLENQNELLEASEGFQNSALTLNKKKQELNELEGKSNEQLQKQQIAIIENLQTINRQQVERLEKQLENLEATSLEVGFWETIKTNIAFALFGTKALASETANLATQRLKEIDDLKAKIKEQKTEEIDLEIQLFNAKNTGERGALPQVESPNALTPEDEAILSSAEILSGELKKIGITDAENAAKIAQIIYDNNIRWSDLEAQDKLAIAQTVLGGVAGLIDKQSIAGKGIAIAQTGINTAQGIMQAFATLPTIPAFVASALVGATGLIQIQKIAKEKIPSATGRGFVSGGNAGGAPTPAPSFNLVEGTADSQLSNDITSANNNPVRAVVVSGDVTTAQSVDRNIVTEAGI